MESFTPVGFLYDLTEIMARVIFQVVGIEIKEQGEMRTKVEKLGIEKMRDYVCG